MKIILLEDVTRLGGKDDVVEVKNGYARNFLIPEKKAILATESALKILAENQRQRAHKEAKLKEEAIALGAKLETVKLSIGAKTSSEGKIFGSVNNIQIAEALAANGYEIDRKQILIEKDSIKNVGAHTVKVKLHKEVVIEITFDVVSE